MKPRRRRVWPWIVGGAIGAIAGVALIVGVFAGTFAREAFSVRDDLLAARAALEGVASSLQERDTAAVEAQADTLRARVADAADTVEGPLWSYASGLPAVGTNVEAVQRVTRAVDTLVDDALPPGLQVIGAIDMGNLTLEGGGIDLEPFRGALSSLPVIADAFARAKAQIDPIDESSLLSVVAAPVSQLTGVIDQAAPTLDVVNRYLPTLLGVAGADGPRTYLIVFQNNAEIRATGGNPAASIIMNVDNGRFSLLEQADSGTFYEAGTAGDARTPLPAETLALYPDSFTRFSQDYTMTPDFPTTALLFQDLWAATSGERFDGVISIDPVVLANMLAVAGPVTLDSGESITADNAVSVLLSEAYERYPDGARSDAFFAEVAQRVFTHLTSAAWDPGAMLSALQKSADQQRVNLAFTDPAAQAFADELGINGALRADVAGGTQLGIYLNDYSVGKLEYHLSTTVSASCDPSARTVTVTNTLANSIPDSIKSHYTLGARNDGFGIPNTSMMLDVLFFAPPGATIVSTDPGAGDIRGMDRSGAERGNSAESRLVVVGQGETRTVAYTVALPEGPLGPLDLRHTPTARDTPVTVDASCDALFTTAG